MGGGEGNSMVSKTFLLLLLNGSCKILEILQLDWNSGGILYLSSPRLEF